MAIVTIIGAGMMGSALAFPARENGNEVRLVGTHLDREIIETSVRTGRHPKFNKDFPAGIKFYQVEEMEAAIKGADLIVGGVSSFGVDWFGDVVLPKIPDDIPVLSVTKGLWDTPEGKLLTYPEVWQKKLDAIGSKVKLNAIGGPCTSYELIAHDQTEVTFCGRDMTILKKMKAIMATDYYHVSLSTDLIGIESAVALKNGYALGIALTIGLNQKAFGPDSEPHFNSQAAVFGQAVKEMSRLLAYQGAETLENLCVGAGDLYVTVYGGRTRMVGILLGRGLNVDEAKAELDGVTLESLVVAVRVARAVRVAAGKEILRIEDFPLLCHVDEILTDKKPVNIPWEKFTFESENPNGREQWLSQWRGVLSERDFRIVKKASGILLQNIAPNEEGTLWNPYRAITPSMTLQPSTSTELYFPGIWNWDSAFHMMGVARFDRKLAQEQMEAFFLFQKENGELPDLIRLPSGGSKIEDYSGKPPVWAWALQKTDERQPDDAFLAKMYPKLVKNESFWRTERYSEADGLFFYSCSAKDPGEMKDTYIRWESGLDDSIRFDDGVIDALYPIDLNCFMVSFYRAMRYLAKRQGLDADAAKWKKKETCLTERILKVLWSEKDQCFWDWSFRDKDFIRVVTPALFMPLWVGIATKEQAAAVERFAKDPKKLYPCMPTVAFDHPKFNEHGYWRGPVWMNVAYFAIKGLYDYGFRETAMQIRETLLNWMDKDRSIHENYNPYTGRGRCASEFSWSCVFAMEMIFEMK